MARSSEIGACPAVLYIGAQDKFLQKTVHDEPNQANFAVLLVTGYLPKIYIISIIFIYY